MLVACNQPKRGVAGDAGADAAVAWAAPVDAGPSPAEVARAAALKRAGVQLAALKYLVAIKKTTSKEVEGEGDAESICDAVKDARAKTTDVEIAAKQDESLALCGFDVPLLYANEALDHLVGSTSQASVLLMCERSAKQIARARAAKPGDPKLRAAEIRRANSRCNK